MSDFYCQSCGCKLSLPRKKSSRRERGHIKTMWCPTCQCEQDFIEVRAEDFSLDYVKEKINAD